MAQTKSPRNKTISITGQEREVLQNRLSPLPSQKDIPLSATDFTNVMFHLDCRALMPLLPAGGFDMIFADPPYNIKTQFKGHDISTVGNGEYRSWLETWIPKVRSLLRPNGTFYICGDWRSSHAIIDICSQYFVLQNRITFSRNKGRGSSRNWKQDTEDIWHFTLSDDFYFDVSSVMILKKVHCPYFTERGNPKGWTEKDSNGERFRLKYPSNFWDDITTPFWAMQENTDHPTQKSEHMLARLILASTAPGGAVFDPFLGSGTTAVTAKKLGRLFCGCDTELDYLCMALKRLDLADNYPGIYRYENSVFREKDDFVDSHRMCDFCVHTQSSL